MPFRLLLFVALLTVFAPDGAKEGRRGNAHYRAERYGDAAEAYRQGLAQHAENARGDVPSGLMNNLGAAFFQTGDFREAQIAFGKSVFMADEPPIVARALYNLGNTFASNEEIELALTAYREALLTEPNNEDAKFNYEFLKRQLQQQQQQNQEQQEQQDEQDQEGTGRPEQPEKDGEQKENPDQPQQDEQQPGEQEQNPPQQDQPQDAGTEQMPNEQQPNAEQPPEDDLNRQQAERILQALQNEEEQLLRQVQQMKSRPREVDKDW